MPVINHEIIVHYLSQMRSLMRQRLAEHFTRDGAAENKPITLTKHEGGDEHPLASFIAEHKLGTDEQVLLLLALIPHFHPNFFDPVIQEFMPHGGDFAEFGGIKSGNHRGLVPTGETAIFLLAGNELQKRISLRTLFGARHLFAEKSILHLEAVKPGEPAMSGRLLLNPEWLDRLITGNETAPRFGTDFPARHIQTRMHWDDVVLNTQTLEQIKTLRLWLEHHATVENDKVFSKKIKQGYRVLFFGPPGTGKTLMATLLGNEFDRHVYRIDLSQVVSKYIGETEKNLEKIFTSAANKKWILFFDEADSLFGKRTGVQSSNDRYANQEVSYLLQRVEDFPGLIILATNYKANIDDAFLRRFNQLVHFPRPNTEERKQLWVKAQPELFRYEPALDLNVLAKKYEVTGASIINIVHYAALNAASRKDSVLLAHDILEGLRREYQKEERTM